MNIVGPKIYYGKTFREYLDRYGEAYSRGDLWDFSQDDIDTGAVEMHPDMVYWFIDGRYYETGEVSINEQITRDDLVQIINDIYGDVDKFLDMIDNDNVPANFSCIYQDEELYLIDDSANRYIHWYKKTHIGRDFHTDMETKEEIIEFFKRLSKGAKE